MYTRIKSPTLPDQYLALNKRHSPRLGSAILDHPGLLTFVYLVLIRSNFQVYALSWRRLAHYLNLSCDRIFGSCNVTKTDNIDLKPETIK